MKDLLCKIILIIIATALGTLIALTLTVLILGPSKTDKVLRSLFHIENYQKGYNQIFPLLAKIPETGKIQNTDLEPSHSTREIVNKADTPPLMVPSSGIAPSAAFLYTGPLSEGKHEGIDIWTNTNGTGMDGETYGKGNPVYAACNGHVRTVWKENGDVSVICDDLDEIYKDYLPSLKIKTLYGHMADQFSSKVYIYVKEGQQVKQGDLIGHQGNRCYWAPRNRVVHLHFGVYDISNVKQIPLDPTPYIGVSCTTLNQEFVAK